ncbi:exodeoxyribonuclease VII large subunit [Hahella sp. CCB-MM4]|uniref:exodeoxyribonuclease VII large subunit n=1 Tax=Hahella sp. (strain CCB-MM4) TaxID=1926491 RepID=UPI000B9AED22|nr:exodeoxyribonuclease VII large subunit [Hahella sp. CCB-MM4]OZG72094.1 exodeoxyribonuclease VII large subunit [Hahella sp. CCB-MM4]
MNELSPKADSMQRPLTVTELNRQARNLLEVSFMHALVEGEISNFSAPSSGHWYFTLKDDKAQVRCAMFRNRNMFLRERPKNGDAVTLYAKVSLYEGRGEYQLIVESLEAAGEGALRRAFEELKAKLLREGLFDEQRKKPIPRLPKRVGVVTSPTGAAIRDIISVLKARFPALPVLILPVPVQGVEAAPAVVKAIQTANRDQLCDVLIVGRGGGSLEDLWAFNEEIVARAIADSHIPIVSAVGHETDFTIADLVADWRAPTPSAAAEKVSPDYRDWLERFHQYQNRLDFQITRVIRQKRQKTTELGARLKHPGRRLQELSQRVDDIEIRLQRTMRSRLQTLNDRLSGAHHRLGLIHPEKRIRQGHENLSAIQARLQRAMHSLLTSKQQHLARTVAFMEGVSPLATLSRGFSITSNAAGEILRHSDQVTVGEQITTRLNQGTLTCTVTAAIPEGS